MESDTHESNPNSASKDGESDKLKLNNSVQVYRRANANSPLNSQTSSKDRATPHTSVTTGRTTGRNTVTVTGNSNTA